MATVNEMLAMMAVLGERADAVEAAIGDPITLDDLGVTIGGDDPEEGLWLGVTTNG